MSAFPHCVFCAPEVLTTRMMSTPHFLVIADHAPLVPGHTLIIPQQHYPCYGAVPGDLDEELVAIRDLITGFLTRNYPAVTWFEHGVFHQTVYHAHLHAMPLGAIHPSVTRDAALGGVPIANRADLRAWYAEHGHYTYLEEPDGAAAIFPASETTYRAMLVALHQRHTIAIPRVGAADRLRLGAPHVRTLLETWQASGLPADWRT